jgi:DNA helicase-2/ATP-dependent DNA helicase PcrA
VFENRWDDGLDEQQLAAATHGDAPLVVLAGAGTGKTRTLTSRVAHLLDVGVAPERILLLTFTRRAADDMLARVGTVCADPDATRRVWGGTFHAIAHRVVAEHSAAIGLEHMSVLDPGDVTDLIDMLRDAHGLTAETAGRRPPRAATMAEICSRAVNTGRPARDVIATDYPWCEPHADAIVGLLREFMIRKRTRGLLDFDDLLLTWRALLDDAVLGPRLRARWDHVLVDEYQDVNQIQVDIVTRLRPDGDGLTVVGDDAQAVYGFRAARAGHLLNLADRLPGARIVKLERNFRARQALLDLANEVRPGDGPDRIRLTAHRHEPLGSRPAQRPVLFRCHDAAAEARHVADTVLAAVEDGGRLRDHAVLMRSAHHSDLLELELTARHVPFVKYGGLKFVEAAHVKDFLAAGRVLINPHDELAWFRLLRQHPGMGPARARSVLDVLLADPADINAATAAAPPPARTALTRTLTGLVDASQLGPTAPVHSGPGSVAARQAEACLRVVEPLVEQRYRDHAVRMADLGRLTEAAAAAPDLATFIADITLDPPASTSDYAQPPALDEDWLTLSTVHSAKGLEWPAVHLIHAVDGAFPSDMALSTPDGLEEERRVFYVAVTRARDRLNIYTPLRMPHHRNARDDRHSYAPQARFLTDEAVALMDLRQPESRQRQPTPDMVAESLRNAARVAVPTMDELFG